MANLAATQSQSSYTRGHKIYTFCTNVISILNIQSVFSQNQQMYCNFIKNHTISVPSQSQTNTLRDITFRILADGFMVPRNMQSFFFSISRKWVEEMSMCLYSTVCTGANFNSSTKRCAKNMNETQYCCSRSCFTIQLVMHLLFFMKNHIIIKKISCLQFTLKRFICKSENARQKTYVGDDWQDLVLSFLKYKRSLSLNYY